MPAWPTERRPYFNVCLWWWWRGVDAVDVFSEGEGVSSRGEHRETQESPVPHTHTHTHTLVMQGTSSTSSSMASGFSAFRRSLHRQIEIGQQKTESEGRSEGGRRDEGMGGRGGGLSAGL